MNEWHVPGQLASNTSPSAWLRQTHPIVWSHAWLPAHLVDHVHGSPTWIPWRILRDNWLTLIKMSANAQATVKNGVMFNSLPPPVLLYFCIYIPMVQTSVQLPGCGSGFRFHTHQPSASSGHQHHLSLSRKFHAWTCQMTGNGWPDLLLPSF